MRWVGEGMHCQGGQVKQGGRIQTPKGVVRRKGEERLKHNHNLLNLAFINWNPSSAGRQELFTDPRSIYLAIDFRYLLFDLQMKVNAGG